VKNKRYSKYFKYAIIIIVSLFCIFGGCYVYNQFQQKTPIPSVNKLIKEKEKNKYQQEVKEPEPAPYINELPNYRQQYGNQYIMGKLEIPGVKINALVTRASNNEFYLNNNLYNQHDGLGVPFFDYRNTDLVNAKQINIYGHNTQNSKYYDALPFINLEAYIDKNMFDNYKDVYLSIDEKKMEYEIVAIKILTDGNPEHMKVNFQNEGDFLSHMERLLSGSLYKNEPLNIDSKDRILILQVCHYNPPGSYLLVICREK